MTGFEARIAKSVLFSGCWHSLETLQSSSPATAMIVISESNFRRQNNSRRKLLRPKLIIRFKIFATDTQQQRSYVAYSSSKHFFNQLTASMTWSLDRSLLSWRRKWTAHSNLLNRYIVVNVCVTCWFPGLFLFFLGFFFKLLVGFDVYV